MSLGLPVIPKPYFWRVKPGHFFGPTVVVEIRRHWKLGPLRWSTQFTKCWTTPELMHVATDDEAAVKVAHNLVRELDRVIRKPTLTIAGDYKD